MRCTLHKNDFNTLAPEAEGALADDHVMQSVLYRADLSFPALDPEDALADTHAMHSVQG